LERSRGSRAARAVTGRIRATIGTRVFSLAALALLLGASAGDGDLKSSLQLTAAVYFAHIDSIAPVAGRDTTFDYYQRLLDDADQLSDPAVPAGYAQAQWAQTVSRTAQLDLSLAKQLLASSVTPFDAMGSIRGLGETFVRSSKDGTMQPVAVYVPPDYRPGRPASLVVLLHGHPQSETQLLSPPYLALLAAKTNTIVVAPWGRGYYDFRGSVSDVYDAFDAAIRAFAIDPRKRYLAGYSMGGFSVFEVAPVHPNDWSAVMCIAGSLLGSDAPPVLAMLRTVPFYVLTGSDDESIPTRYPASTAAYLHAAGLDVSFYSQPGGIHRMITLLPILTLAWNDMLAQIVRAPPENLGRIQLPASIPMSALKP
jgi:poly(3-hydroxybutyrate) depolymerase